MQKIGGEAYKHLFCGADLVSVVVSFFEGPAVFARLEQELSDISAKKESMVCKRSE
ncbi:hypothetical protein ACKP2L_07090 [Oenococcus alcoholitolerans]|uniref:Uncharacterized protein n=1 Tax=Oenococcus alcoholitolerans TaxID=931074 RepID=A0ABR4XSG6_9LACO|nr:hypothetical protein Q757_01035 [Oenococcus alcoholitolerans]